jgi:NADH dehydrogenase (ubiquinone) 1 beta subcomplex subunit 9
MGDAQALLKETEKLLEKWKHPDPYVHPTAPGGAHFHDCVLNR